MKLKTLRKRADKLLQIKCVSENPRCFLCGERTWECHHFIQKKQSRATRYLQSNLIPLCRDCHNSVNKGREIIKIKGQKWLQDLLAKSRVIQKETPELYKKVLKDLNA